MKKFTLPESFSDKKVCVMGLGYVGLTFAVTLADIGFEVFGVEVKDDILKMRRPSEIKEALKSFYEEKVIEIVL